jgi:DNA-binding LacI/PurR family transcriptional regulator
MRTRLKDIAQDLKISTGLVSGVLNGRSNVWASEETRRKIFDAAKRLNYIPAAPVKVRPASASGIIELVFCRNQEELSHEFASLVAALSEVAEELGMSCIISGFSTRSKVLYYLESQPASRTDVIVLWGSSSLLREMGSILESLGCPFVVAGRDSGGASSWTQFSVDHEEMIVGAIDHIRVQGHRRIAYIGSESRSSHDEALRSSFLRWTRSCFGKDAHGEFLISSKPGVDSFRSALAPLLAMSETEGPTGFVVGAGNDAWTALEMCLAERGQKLGFSTGLRSAAGLYERNLHLLFGDALGYDVTTSADSLAETLRPLISPDDLESQPQVRRNVPRLSRIPSLNLRVSSDPTQVGKVIR